MIVIYNFRLFLCNKDITTLTGNTNPFGFQQIKYIKIKIHIYSYTFTNLNSHLKNVILHIKTPPFTFRVIYLSSLRYSFFTLITIQNQIQTNANCEFLC